MTVKELIEQLQKLPPNDDIVAEVIGDDFVAGIIYASKYFGDMSSIMVDRTRELEEHAACSMSARNELRRRIWEEEKANRKIEEKKSVALTEEPEDEDVW